MVADYKNNTAKPKHIGLKVENIILLQPYAITINPEMQFTKIDRKTKVKDYSYPHMAMKSYIQTWLKLCKGSKYELYFETSPIGRQHYHGLIHVHDIQVFYSVDIHILQMLGTFVIKPLKEAEEDENLIGSSWYAYCTKQEKIWKDTYTIITKSDISK